MNVPTESCTEALASDMEANNVKTHRTIPISEVFFSIEGEGILTGFPTLFVRSFGCNFTCSGFGQPPKTAVDIPLQRSLFTGRDFQSGLQSLKDFVVAPIGCDSAYSWAPEYKHLAQQYDVEHLVAEIRRILPANAFLNRLKPTLSLTGGEPMLHQKFWTEFVRHPFIQQFDRILIETNGSVHITKDFTQALLRWSACNEKSVIWANSPKLSLSGEPRHRAVRPLAILSQRESSSIQYFKFVTDGSEDSVAEIKDVISEYEYSVGPIEGPAIQLMPVGATKDQQEELQRRVAEVCMAEGFVLCSRVHIWIFGNSVGT